MIKRFKKLSANQNGLAAIIVSIVIIILLTLVTLSFSRIVTREQRQALDRELSTQAFYAAESAVNEVAGKIQANFGQRFGTPYDFNKTHCQEDGDFSSGTKDPNSFDYGKIYKFDPLPTVETTCVLVNVEPPTLEFSAISTTESQIVPVESHDVIDSIKISWNAKDGKTGLNCPAIGQFPPNDQWAASPGPCDTGVLRTDITPTPDNFCREDLIEKTFVLFLYPSKFNSASNQDGQISYTNDVSKTDINTGIPINCPHHGPEDGGEIEGGACDSANTPKYCNVKINNLSTLGLKRFYLRLRSIYQDAAVTITAYNSSGQQVSLINSQAMIDSTGKDSDVLRRIQVRVPIKKQFPFPENAIETMDSLCKQLSVAPNYASAPSGAGNEGCALD